MNPRLHVEGPYVANATIELPAGAARHVQVLRLQPGSRLTLFDGQGVECTAEVTAIGRREVSVRLGLPQAVDRELDLRVTLAFGMPANERMDALVEKACELGVAAIEPLVCERSVLRLQGERAEKRQAHWQAVAIAAAEQCGRAHVPPIARPAALAAWLACMSGRPVSELRWVLSLDPAATPLADLLRQAQALPASGILVLSGPEGGLSPAEELAARAAGFVPASLGPRTLRADTAPLAALAVCGAMTAP